MLHLGRGIFAVNSCMNFFLCISAAQARTKGCTAGLSKHFHCRYPSAFRLRGLVGLIFCGKRNTLQTSTKKRLKPATPSPDFVRVRSLSLWRGAIFDIARAQSFVLVGSLSSWRASDFR